MPTMFRNAALAAACASLLAAALPSHAAGGGPPVDCRDSATKITGGGSYTTCSGPYDGMLMGTSTEEDDLFFLFRQQLNQQLFYKGKSSDPGNGPFFVSNSSLDPGGKTSGMLTFDSLQKGLFVVALQSPGSGGFDPNYSYYLFDGGSTGIGSLDFDTKGLYRSLADTSQGGPPLAFAALYAAAGAAGGAVPEPASLGLAIAALAALGLTRRRAG